ncbi:MAG TPA: ABC transporter permease, partial [Bryobacteraceae bacterium]
MILLSDLGQAFGNLRAQKTRTFLTAIGIVFGVGSVIGMMAIGAGAREESLRFIEQLGVRNILIDSRQAMSQEELQQRRRSSPGLSERDVRILQANIDAIEVMSARRTLHPSAALPKPSKDVPELYGVRPSYSSIHSLQFAEGRFFDASDDDRSALVCVLGENAKVNMLGYDAAVGKFVKVNDTWLEVVGVLKEQLMAGSQSSGGTMQDINNIIYIP